MTVPTYSFLSQPPPQKKRPLIPLPPTPRPCAISTWAAHVQPGSPGHSPRQRGRGRSTPSPRTPSRSFLLIETPSPDAKDFSIDLTDLGYTSVFLHLPKTPATPSLKSPPATKPLKRFRSLSILRPRRNNRSTTTTLPPSPTKSPRAASRSKAESPKILAASIARRKKATYAYAAPKKTQPSKKPDLPPSLAAELALMQFADGGSTEANIKRLMEAHARANAPAGTQSGDRLATGVADVYRDGKGGVWWDREEEIEYMHLLSGQHPASASQVESTKWVSFGGEVKDDVMEQDDGALALASLAGVPPTRPGGSATSSTLSFTSSLDPSNIVKLAEDDSAMLMRIPLSPAVIIPTPPGMDMASFLQDQLLKHHQQPPPILSIPSRPRSTNHHVRTSPRFFVFDSSHSSSVLVSPQTPRSALRSPKTPRSPYSPYAYVRTTGTGLRSATATATTTSRVTFPHPVGQKRRPAMAAGGAGASGGGRRRRRPAPLNIVAHAPMRGVSPELDEDDDDEDVQLAGKKSSTAVAKREFIEDSFEPPAPVAAATVTGEGGNHHHATIAKTAEKQRMVKKKASKAILGIFGRK